MKIPIATTSFTRSVIAGLFTGILTATANFLFVLFYRSGTGVNAYEFIISPFFIFITFPILSVLTGFVYFAMNHYLPKGAMWYSIFFVLLTLLAILYDFLSPGNESLLAGSKGLLFGIATITGLMIAFLLPYLARHPKIFMMQEGIQESK